MPQRASPANALSTGILLRLLITVQAASRLSFAPGGAQQGYLGSLKGRQKIYSGHAQIIIVGKSRLMNTSPSKEVLSEEHKPEMTMQAIERGSDLLRIRDRPNLQSVSEDLSTQGNQISGCAEKRASKLQRRFQLSPPASKLCLYGEDLDANFKT